VGFFFNYRFYIYSHVYTLFGSPPCCDILILVIDLRKYFVFVLVGLGFELKAGVSKAGTLLIEPHLQFNLGKYFRGRVVGTS
jgi:hypothetical protein